MILNSIYISTYDLVFSLNYSFLDYNILLHYFKILVSHNVTLVFLYTSLPCFSKYCWRCGLVNFFAATFSYSKTLLCLKILPMIIFLLIIEPNFHMICNLSSHLLHFYPTQTYLFNLQNSYFIFCRLNEEFYLSKSQLCLFFLFRYYRVCSFRDFHFS